jgi:Zn-dependent metalloprotease
MRKPLLTLCAALLCAAAFSQNKILQQEASWGQPTFARFNLSPGAQTPFSINAVKAMLHLAQGAELRLEKSETDNIGMQHEHYVLYYHNIRVEGMGYSIHGRNNILHSLDGNYFSPSGSPVKTAISGKQAIDIALKAVPAKKYYWDDEIAEHRLKERTRNNAATYFPEAVLVYSPVYSKENDPTFKLCYRLEIVALEPFSAEFIYIDALSGKIYKRISKMKHLDDVQGTAQTRYSGTQTIWTNRPRFRTSIARYTLDEYNVSGFNNMTIDYRYNGTNDEYYRDADNNWTEAEHNKDMGLDIHWASERAYDFCKTVLNRNGYNNLTGEWFGSTNVAHYEFDGGPLAQAQAGYIRFHSYDNIASFLFGDGDAYNDQMASLDIYGHEYGHGLWDFTIRNVDVGNDVQKEYGALQEGMANIWASIIENWAAPTKNSWVIGEEVTYNHLGHYNLAYPNANMQPDTYMGTFWQNTTSCTPDAYNDYCGTHTNAGIMHYWFYLLSQGGSGVNDLGNAFAVTGIGNLKIAQILYRNMNHYWYNSGIGDGTVFPNARNRTIQAATELYGANSCEVIAVTNAWHAVGVGAAYSSGYSISGNSLICSSELYSVSGVPAGYSVNWTPAVNPHLSFSSATSNPTVVTKLTPGWMDFYAIIKDQSGCIVGASPAKSVFLGTPFAFYNVYYYPGPEPACYGTWSFHTFRADLTWGMAIESVEWGYRLVGVPGSEVIYPYDVYVYTFFPYEPGEYEIFIRPKNSCGTGMESVKRITVSECWGMRQQITTYPNPAKDEIIVSITSKGTIPNPKPKQTAPIDMELVDVGTGLTINRWRMLGRQSQYRLNVASIKTGIYALRIIDGDNKTGKLIRIEK